jgi:hypothetical protein
MNYGLQRKKVSLVCTAVLLLSFFALARTANCMGKAYTDDELAKVREWEKKWAGQKIDKTNIEQVAELMPESYVGIYKNPELWGAPPEGFFFNIVPYQEVLETKGFIEATKKYAPEIKLNADGTIANYATAAGRPFPEPKNGLEAAYNYDFNNHGDTAHYRRYCPNITPKSKSERLSDQEYWEFFFIHRTDVDPVPAVPDNTKGYHRAMFNHMYKPAEFLNTRMYTARFIDPAKEDEAYLWYSQNRRIRRLSTSQRTDTIDGSDLIYDDEYFWDGQISRNNYTLKNKKELLCSRHTDMKQTTRSEGQAIVNNIALERCNTLVVEVVNKDPNYLYGKRIWYLDPESYIILWTEIYDNTGRFWKCFMQNCAVVKTKKGEQKHFIVGSQFEDFQRTHAGLSNQQYYFDPELGGTVTRDMFTTGNLQKTY